MADELNIAPRYIASIENSGQHPSRQIFYELVNHLDISVDQFFFPQRETDKSIQRRQLDSLIAVIKKRHRFFDLRRWRYNKAKRGLSKR